MEEEFTGTIFAIIFSLISAGQWFWVVFFNGAGKFIKAVDAFHEGKYKSKFPYKLIYKKITINILSTVSFMAGLLTLFLIFQRF